MDERDLLIIADAGPLIRLAAADLLDCMRLTNRRIVIVDCIEERVCGDLSKPFSQEIAAWIRSMGSAIEHAETLEGIAISALRVRADSDPDRRKLKQALRNSGERAIREYVEMLNPTDFDEALVLYEDSAVPSLMAAATVPVTLMTTRAFARMVAERGYNRDAVLALESVAVSYSLKPVVQTIVEANTIVGGGFDG